MDKTTKEKAAQIKAFLTKVSEREPDSIPDNVKASVNRMLQAVYSNQTADEKMTESTRYRNGMGFSGVDSQFLSNVATNAQKYGKSLTGKQTRVVAKSLKKYSGQIAQFAVNG